MRLSYRVKVLSAVGLGALALPAGVYAQPDQEQVASDTQTDTPSAGLAPIVVTARRREESLQETPISITAFGGAELEARNLNDIADVGQFTPNVVIDGAVTLSGSSASTSVTIRGVGQTDFTFNADPAVGTYVDGVYISRAVGGLINLLDIERVEVLRGPQGTLFGKNSTGGAINITTVAPNQTFSGKVGAQIGSYDLREIFGSINVPLGDTVAVRASASYRNRDGYVESLQGGEDFGSLDSFSGRARLRWEPTDTLTIDLTFDGTVDRQSALPIVLIGSVDPFGTPFAAAFNAGAQPMGACFAPTATGNPACFNSQWVAGPFSTNANPDSRSNLDLWGASGFVEWEMSDAITLRSITAYRTYDSDTTADLDGSPLVVFDDVLTQNLKAFSQEVQLLGEALDGRLNWIAGVYYLNERGTHVERIRTAIGVLNAGGLTVNESKAAFAQATMDLTDRLSLTAGVRYTDETRQYTPSSSFFELGGPPLIILPNVTSSISASEFTPLVNVAYAVSDAVNVYATFSRGFKSGGFSQRITEPLPGPPSFNPEFVNLYEIGLKFQSPDNVVRLNTAVFQSDYTDLQVLGFTPGIVGATTINAGEARIRGAEVELALSPVREFTLQAGLGYLDAKYTRLDPAVFGIALNDPLPNTPEVTISATASYRIQATPEVSVTPNVGWSYQDAVTNTAVRQPLLDQPSYHLVNGGVTLGLMDDTLKVNVGVKNLLDETYLVSGQDTPAIGTVYGTYGLPRTWYVRLDFDF